MEGDPAKTWMWISLISLPWCHRQIVNSGLLTKFASKTIHSEALLLMMPNCNKMRAHCLGSPKKDPGGSEGCFRVWARPGCAGGAARLVGSNWSGTRQDRESAALGVWGRRRRELVWWGSPSGWAPSSSCSRSKPPWGCCWGGSCWGPPGKA